MKLDEILNKIVSASPSAFFFTPQYYKNSKSYLFTYPERVITVQHAGEFDAAFREVEELLDKGYFGFAVISYETSYLLEPRLKDLLPPTADTKFLQFFLYKSGSYVKINSIDIGYSEHDSFDEPNSITNFSLNVSKAEYCENVRKIKKYIAEGDTYQVNYTVKGKFEFNGSAAGLFLSGIFNQSARYCAFINTGEKYIISFSPELFFSSHNQKLITMPMKGTIKRGKSLTEDKLNQYNLKHSQKDQAENLMIVDLLRNDMGRISRFGTVKVEKLFNIEKYETLYQMVSVISSALIRKNHLRDIILNLFPGGSITGAPKIRTMEIIRELEKEPRGIYTGAIGLFNKNNSVFNLPIRTIVIDKKDKSGEIGLGSGIVWDSDPEKEYQETWLKSNFLLKGEKPFQIFETMLLEKGQIFLADMHLKRMENTAGYFLFRFNKKAVKKVFSDTCNQSDVLKKYKLKVSLNKWGCLTTELTELTESLRNIKIIVSAERIDSGNKYFYFKTTHRELYAREYAAHIKDGFQEVIFMNENNELCEGSFTNVFIKKKNIWFTPPVQCGLLNGTYRQMLLKDKSRYKEKVLYPEDLKNADEVMVVNSLRKEIPVVSVCLDLIEQT